MSRNSSPFSHRLCRKMNSLNILSSRVIGPTTVSRPRSRSQGEILSPDNKDDILRGRSFSDRNLAYFDKTSKFPITDIIKSEDPFDDACVAPDVDDEKSPLLRTTNGSDPSVYKSRLRSLVKRIADALTALLTTIGAPVIYVASCFQDEKGQYSPVVPLKRIRRSLARRRASRSTASAVGLSKASNGQTWEAEKLSTKRHVQDSKLRHSYSSESLKSTTSESESEKTGLKQEASEAKLTARSGVPADKSVPRRSIRIKLHTEDSRKRRKQRKAEASGAAPGTPSPPLTVDNIKSPISPSPSHKVTRYPHVPQPPRPLIPRRQPSYSNLNPRSLPSHAQSPSQQQKTLIIDLDETLIHSLAKGGRMSSGHMVEVKLNAPVLAPSPSQPSNHPTPVIGPQHPILYYVHKRPHCDEFLRKVCRWYKLVVFTASVQEYADPVIDWLEQERKFFVGRYYRQHCTFRNGAYIKDLSSVEPDLSRVIILDNSPMSYIFQEGTWTR